MVENNNVCDICGAPTTNLRTITHPKHGIIEALSGYTCLKCVDEGKESEYVNELMDKFNENPDLADQLELRFDQILNDKINNFTSENGPGVDKKCEICGKSNSYLCVVEDRFEGNPRIIDKFSGFYCAECIVSGQKDTHIDKAIKGLEKRKPRPDVLARRAKLMEKERLAYKGNPFKTVIAAMKHGDTCSCCGCKK
jgi:hypothetical protein